MFSRYPKAYLQDLERQTHDSGRTHRNGPAWGWFLVPITAFAVVVYGFVITVDQSLAPFDAPLAVAQPVTAIAPPAGAGPDSGYLPDRYTNSAREPAEPVDTF